jgi:hypothetical protein
MLQVARPGDRRWDEMTLERVVLSSIRASRSTWKFLVCKGPQMTETVWLSVASAKAATKLGLTARPNEWCQVTPCDST